MNKERLADMLAGIIGADNVKIDEPMKPHTSFKIGGPADILVTPVGAENIRKVINICKNQNVPYIVCGNGTNLIVRDKGIRGVVIKIFNNLNKCTVKGEVIEAEAGVLLSKAANIALQNGLAGLEFAAGIPGTVGGAVAMNAGAYGGEMKDVVIRTRYIDDEGEIKTLVDHEHQFGYRSSLIQKVNGVVLESEFRLNNGDKQEIKALMEELNGRRKEKQPLALPSAGSVFKRPEGYFAGKLVEDCGLKGFSIGGAEVSCLHCGFIVNTGNATADDVINLISHIQSEVKSRYNVELCTEVKIIGEE